MKFKRGSEAVRNMSLKTMTVVECIAYIVNQIVEEHYQFEECPPTFIVSQLEMFEAMPVKHFILLTIVHNGMNISRIMFPNNTSADYNSLYNEMIDLYNSTM